MTWQILLMDANAIVCLLIMVRLMFFRKEGKRHRLSVAVLAYWSWRDGGHPGSVW